MTEAAMDPKAHWEAIYTTKRPDEVSWYAAHLHTSIDLIRRAAPDRAMSVIDVGGGESTLVDDLLTAGYQNVHVLDLSSAALAVARSRLGQSAESVEWIRADVTQHIFSSAQFDLWHDRAVFHFLTDAQARDRYVEQVAHAVRPGGHVIVATFGPGGPLSCSGLDVVRYDPEGLHNQFGTRFELIDHRSDLHTTPAGRTQQFVYCLCRVNPACA
jgi:SAM-dependent methyltransferase